MIVVWKWSIFQRCMMQSLLSVTVTSTIILSLLVWLVQSLRYCSMMAYTSLSLLDVGWLAFYLWPKTIVVSVSLSYIYGIVWVLGRWKRYHMLTAMQSAGASHGFVWAPVLIIGAVLSLALSLLAHYGGPGAAQVSHRYASMLDKRFNPSFMIPKVFFSIAGKTLYSGEQLSNQEWKNVFIHDISHAPQERLLYAQRVILRPQKQGLWMDVHHGTIITTDHNTNRAPHCVYWKRYQGWYKGDLETAKSLSQMLPHRWVETLDNATLDAWTTGPHRSSWSGDHPPVDSSQQEKRHQSSPSSSSPQKVPLMPVKSDPKNWNKAAVLKAAHKEKQYRFFWPMWPILNALCLPLWWICDYPWLGRMWRGGALFGLYAGMMTGWAGYSLLMGLLIFVLVDGRRLWQLRSQGRRLVP
jgi:hypothetical protein